MKAQNKLGSNNLVLVLKQESMEYMMKKRVWFEVELLEAQRDREAEGFQVSNDDTTVAQRRLKDKQPKEKTNMGCLVKEHEKEYQTGWKIKMGNVLDSCNQRSIQQCMKSKVAIHLGVAGIQQQNGLVDETNVTLFAKAEIWATKDLLDKAKENVLVMKIVKDHSGYTLRVSQSRFYNGKLVQTLLEGHSILSLEGSLSRDCDVEKNDVGMLDGLDRGLQTYVQVFMDFDYAICRLITSDVHDTYGGCKEENMTNGLLTESRYELRLVAGIATGALEDKIKESKLLIDELDLPRSSDFLPSPEYDSFLFKDFSEVEVDALPSTKNEDNVFNPGIFIYENLSEITVQATPDKNVKKMSISHASLIIEDLDPPLYELPFHKEVPGSKTPLSFSSENEEKVFKPGIITSKGVHTFFSRNYLIGAPKLSKSLNC
nr:zinc finger, CCHC-type [Tanacetum cinerariifolium]